MPELKLCKDCRWAVNLSVNLPADSLLHNHDNNWECDHPSSLMPAPPSLVTGRPPPPMRMACGWARSMNKSFDGAHETCGRDGRFWEPLTVGFGTSS